MLEQQALGSDFSNKIFFSDDVNFLLEGTYVIKGSENPRGLGCKAKCPMGYLIRAYFFENDNGETVTV